MYSSCYIDASVLVESDFGQEELQALQALNFGRPEGGTTKKFLEELQKQLQMGKQRLPYLLSKPWVKEIIPEILEDEANHPLFLDPELVCNEARHLFNMCSTSVQHVFNRGSTCFRRYLVAFHGSGSAEIGALQLTTRQGCSVGEDAQ